MQEWCRFCHAVVTRPSHARRVPKREQQTLLMPAPSRPAGYKKQGLSRDHRGGGTLTCRGARIPPPLSAPLIDSNRRTTLEGPCPPATGPPCHHHRGPRRPAGNPAPSQFRPPRYGTHTPSDTNRRAEKAFARASTRLHLGGENKAPPPVAPQSVPRAVRAEPRASNWKTADGQTRISVEQVRPPPRTPVCCPSSGKPNSPYTSP